MKKNITINLRGRLYQIDEDAYELLQNSSAALVTSGTATLETALLAVPEVVCYKANRLSFLIAKNLVKVEYISLVNLIMDRMVVKELIQNDFTEANLVKELDRLLKDPKKQKQLLEDIDTLKERLGNSGASKNAAEVIVDMIK